jgi:hypothetical protein
MSTERPDLERRLSRRELLRQSGAGFGFLALSGLLGAEERSPGAAPDALRFPVRARRVIFLFMHGGPSQVDTFDFKPLLQRDHGKPLPFPKPRIEFAETGTGNLLASPFSFARYGESGAWVSELFPHLARRVDDLCFIKSLHGTNEAHGGAVAALHTGSATLVRPSMGSWVLYGLGSENRDLPGFVTLCPTLGHGGFHNWSSAFLPSRFQGTAVGNAASPVTEARIEYLEDPEARPDLQRTQLDLLRAMNEEHLAARGPDERLEARIQSFELAFRMQAEAPAVLSIEGESPATRALYGIGDPVTDAFGRQCLMARRLCEGGVRFVQCTHSYKWDQHVDLGFRHAQNALEVDKPIAGLLADLEAHGLLEDTLVMWGGEFGRTPVSERGNGRDHNPHGFTMWLAGGGVKGGLSYGATDDYGFYAVQDKVHLHDLHATILALLGLDHERLTYRYAGRDFRLTDVAGRVVEEIFA